jgi:hypothetical protein
VIRNVLYWASLTLFLLVFGIPLLIWRHKFYNQNPWEHDPYGRFGE